MSDKTRKNDANDVSRRNVLKGAAATGALAVGASVIGAPTIWAQNIKDITLNHTGMSYSTIIDIARQATQDLGFTVEMSVTDHTGLINRMTNEPKAIDIADSEIWQTKAYVPQGVTQAVEISRIDLWDKITPIYTQGQFAGKEVSREGDSPFEIMYRASKDATSFNDGITDWATFMPGVYNADTLGIRPDLIGRPIDSWAELFNGPNCLTLSSPARPPSRTSPPSALWMPSWPWARPVCRPIRTVVTRRAPRSRPPLTSSSSSRKPAIGVPSGTHSMSP